jgi:hypothetical protein
MEQRGEKSRTAWGEVEWKSVTQAQTVGAAAPFPAPQKRRFMEGFRYRNDLLSTLKPDFFEGFPPVAVFERNLVWDTGMIEMFGQNYFEHLKRVHRSESRRTIIVRHDAL